MAPKHKKACFEQLCTANRKSLRLQNFTGTLRKRYETIQKSLLYLKWITVQLTSIWPVTKLCDFHHSYDALQEKCAGYFTIYGRRCSKKLLARTVSHCNRPSSGRGEIWYIIYQSTMAPQQRSQNPRTICVVCNAPYVDDECTSYAQVKVHYLRIRQM